jgi:hypothetical protein
MQKVAAAIRLIASGMGGLTEVETLAGDTGVRAEAGEKEFAREHSRLARPSPRAQDGFEKELRKFRSLPGVAGVEAVFGANGISANRAVIVRFSDGAALREAQKAQRTFSLPRSIKNTQGAAFSVLLLPDETLRERENFERQVQERFRGVPGVASVTLEPGSGVYLRFGSRESLLRAHLRRLLFALPWRMSSPDGNLLPVRLVGP